MTVSESTTTPISQPRSPVDASVESQTDAQRGFSQSVAISGVRCVLTYLVFPFLFPTVLGALGPALGLIVGSIALASNVFSIRRFWRAQHKWRKPITIVHLGVITLLLFLMFRDIQQLIT